MSKSRLYLVEKSVNNSQNPQSRREFWQSKIQEYPDDEPDEIALAFSVQARVENEKRISSQSNAILSILTAEHNLSDRSVRLLLALCGLSEGRRTFNATYEMIFFHLQKYDPKLKGQDGELKRSALQKVRRYIEALNKDQERTGVIYALITPGRKDNGTRIPTSIELPLLDYLEEISRRVRASPSYSRNSRNIRVQETRKYAAELLASPNYQAKTKPEERKPDKIRRMVKQAAGMLESTIAAMKGEDYTEETIRKWIFKEMSDDAKALLLNESYPAEAGTKEHSGAEINSDTYRTSRVSKLNLGYQNDTLRKPETLGNNGIRGRKGVDESTFTNDESSPLSQASQMIEAFESVGACNFEVTTTNESGRKINYQGDLTADGIRGMLGEMLSECESKQHNAIVRPSGEIDLVQLDDLDRKTIETVADYSFLILETSDANYQAWIAVKGADKEIIRRLKQGTGADMSASGATRIAGSRNFKSKHAPSYPLVRLIATTPGLVLTSAELESSGLLAEQERKLPAPRYAPIAPVSHNGSKSWPSYDRCLSDAPKARNHDGRDRSNADWHFCLFSIDRGFGVEETAHELIRESQKAKEQGFKYALQTAQRAAQSVYSNKSL